MRYFRKLTYGSISPIKHYKTDKDLFSSMKKICFHSRIKKRLSLEEGWAGH
jgi:hypothetical protein